MSEPLKGGFAGFAGGSAFKPLGATGTTGATPNLFGSATPAANAGAPTPAAGTPNAFGGGGNLFGGDFAPKYIKICLSLTLVFSISKTSK